MRLHRCDPRDCVDAGPTLTGADYADGTLHPDGGIAVEITSAAVEVDGWRASPAAAFAWAAAQLRIAAERAAIAAIAAEGPPIRCYYFGDVDGALGAFAFRGPNRSGPLPAADVSALPPAVVGLASSPAACGDTLTDGHGARAEVDGWTVLGFWDRPPPMLPQGRSVFIVEGARSFAEVMRLAEVQFPSTIDRLRQRAAVVEVDRATYWSLRPFSG